MFFKRCRIKSVKQVLGTTDNWPTDSLSTCHVKAHAATYECKIRKANRNWGSRSSLSIISSLKLLTNYFGSVIDRPSLFNQLITKLSDQPSERKRSWPKLTDVNIETIRYYERIGIMPKPRRSDDGQRLYDENQFKRLRFLKRSRVIGFSLEEMRTLLALDDQGGWAKLQRSVFPNQRTPW